MNYTRLAASEHGGLTYGLTDEYAARFAAHIEAYRRALAEARRLLG